MPPTASGKARRTTVLASGRTGACSCAFEPRFTHGLKKVSHINGSAKAMLPPIGQKEPKSCDFRQVAALSHPTNPAIVNFDHIPMFPHAKARTPSALSNVSLPLVPSGLFPVPPAGHFVAVWQPLEAAAPPPSAHSISHNGKRCD